MKFTISGQINRMLLYADDGNQARWFHADNTQSSSRLGFNAELDIDKQFTFGTVFEVKIESNSSSDVTIDQETAVTGNEGFAQRKLEIYFAHDLFGTVSFGQGSTASNSTAEVDLSGTDVIAAASFGATGNNLDFRRSGTKGTRAKVDIDDLFQNFDGLGRDDRILYESPSFQGFAGALSWVDGDEWDVAARYGREFGDTEIAAALSYWNANASRSRDGVSASAAVKAPFGTSLSASWSQEDRKAIGRNTAQFWYVKLGHEAELTKLGDSAISVDFAKTKDQDSNDTEGRYYSLAVTQKLDDIATVFYAIIGRFDVDLPGIETDPITIGGMGARVKF